MLLKRIPKDQRSLISCYFDKRLEPEFISFSLFKGYLDGTCDIRLWDYKGDNNSFEDDVYESAIFSQKSKERLNELINRLWILKTQCEEEEYFELLQNINIIIDVFRKVVARCNEEYLDWQVENVLIETGLKSTHD